ncbi:hypothetical protein AOLI_G00143300 [Acnodon oligacanthus]
MMLDVTESTCCLNQIANPRSSQVISPPSHLPLHLSPPLDTVINHTDWNSISQSSKQARRAPGVVYTGKSRKPQPTKKAFSSFRSPAAIWKEADCKNGCNYAFAMNTCQQMFSSQLPGLRAPSGSHCGGAASDRARPFRMAGFRCGVLLYVLCAMDTLNTLAHWSRPHAVWFYGQRRRSEQNLEHETCVYKLLATAGLTGNPFPPSLRSHYRGSLSLPAAGSRLRL